MDRINAPVLIPQLTSLCLEKPLLICVRKFCPREPATRLGTGRKDSGAVEGMIIERVEQGKIVASVSILEAAWMTA